MTSRWFAAGAAGAVATALLLLLAAIDGPVWLRTILGLAVFFIATGFALVGRAGSLAPGIRWSLVIALSIAVDLLIAELLLVINLFVPQAFLAALLVVQVSALLVHCLLLRGATTLVSAEDPA